jgi:hypothetical protein
MSGKHAAFHSHFFIDGETAFIEGQALDANPYAYGNDAFDAWRAGWLDASRDTLQPASAVELFAAAG